MNNLLQLFEDPKLWLAVLSLRTAGLEFLFYFWDFKLFYFVEVILGVRNKTIKMHFVEPLI